jgi:hypothetical protein
MLEILKTAHSTWGAWIVYYVFEYSRQNDTSVAFFTFLLVINESINHNQSINQCDAMNNGGGGSMLC